MTSKLVIKGLKFTLDEKMFFTLFIIVFIILSIVCMYALIVGHDDTLMLFVPTELLFVACVLMSIKVENDI